MLRLSFILLLCLLLPSSALAEKRVALVIGIDKYDNLASNAQLRRARADAAAVARLLKDLAFDVIAKDDVTRSAFNSYWQDFLNKLAPGDMAAFYFAGHGVEFGRQTYLLPRDVPNIRPGRDELLRREALSLQEFLADLRERGTRLNLVILDACRDNPFEQMAGRSVGARRGLAVTEPPEGTFIMYSAGSGESALDRLDDADRDPNSVYTRHLLPLLKTKGLSLTEIAEQVRVDVRQMAATVQHRQTPAYYNQVIGRVCIAGGECTSRAPWTTTVQQSEMAEAWALTKDTNSIAALEAFIRRYGDTFYADLAKSRLNDLAETAKRAADTAKRKAEEEVTRVTALPPANRPAHDIAVVTLTEATVRARLPGVEVKQSSNRGWLTIGTYREPDILLLTAGFQLVMYWNGIDDDKWPATRISEVLAAEICGQVRQGVMQDFLFRLRQSRSLVPGVDLGGNNGSTFKQRTTESLGTCRVEIIAEGARWHNLTITVRR